MTKKELDIHQIVDPETKRVLSELTHKQRQFCINYTGPTETFGNGVKSYIKAYNLDPTKKSSYQSAKTNAYRMLTKPEILEVCDRLLESHGLNDIHVNKQLNFLITQNSNFSVKLRSIKEYNQLRGRIVKRLEPLRGILSNDLKKIFERNNAQESENSNEVESMLHITTKTSQKPKRAQESPNLIDDILERHGI